MKKILYYASITLAAGSLVCFFVPSYHKYSIFNIMIEAFGYSNSVADAIVIACIIVFALLALLFVAIKKQIPAIIFTALGCALFCTLNVEVVKVIYIILSVLLIGAQVYAKVIDKKEE